MLVNTYIMIKYTKKNLLVMRLNAIVLFWLSAYVSLVSNPTVSHSAYTTTQMKVVSSTTCFFEVGYY